MKTICLDPGHGHGDPGASANGVVEKDLVLRYSLAILQALAIDGYRVVPTRVFDRYPTIPERAALSNRVDADLFLSIHANASGDPKAHGPWTLYAEPSSRGKELATAFQRELAPILSGKPDAVYPDASPWTGGRKLGVLRQTRAPAVLIELGFVTNRADAELLRDEAALAHVTEAVLRAVRGEL